MTAKSQLQRAQANLARDRLKLRAERAELERARLELRQERAELLVWLRLLCERYGDTTWTDATPIAEILERYLAEPLGRTIAAVAARSEALATRLAHAEAALAKQAQVLDPPERRPAELSARAPVDHACVTVASRLRGLAGFRAVCDCGWASPVVTSIASADVAGGEHSGRFSAGSGGRR